MHKAERKASGKGGSRCKGPGVEMCLGCYGPKMSQDVWSMVLRGGSGQSQRWRQGPRIQGRVGFLPEAMHLFVLGEVSEGREQTGVEAESLCGRLVLALRLKTKF